MRRNPLASGKRATSRIGSTRLDWLLVLLALGMLGGCGPEDPAPSAGPTKVICSTAISQPVTDYDEFIGRTEASETVEVRARVSGYLRTVDFVEGAMVKEGDLLATIEPDEYEAIHEQSLSRINLWQAKLDLANASFARTKTLLEQNASSKQEYDEALAAVKEAESQIVATKADAARTALDLKYTKILAPISGRIDRVNLTPGNMVTGGLGSGTAITRIVNNSPIYAYVDVDERSVLRYLRMPRKTSDEAGAPQSLKARQHPCELALQDEQGFPHQGVLDFIENRIDPNTATIRLRGVFANEDQLLTGGLFVRVRIPTSDPYDAVLIHEASIGIDQGEKFVFVINAANKAERRTVELGAQQGSLRVVRSGVKTGERVVVKGIQRVQPGLEVRVEMWEEAVGQEPGSDNAASNDSEAVDAAVEKQE